MIPTVAGVRVHHRHGNKLICYCPFHKGGAERSPSMEIRLDRGRWRCYACPTDSEPLEDLFKRLGASAFEAKRRVEDLRALSDEEEVVKEQVCPEVMLGPFNRRPLSLIKKGYSRAVLDEMEVGYDSNRFRVIYPLRSDRGVLMGVSGGAIVSKNDEMYIAYYGHLPKYIAYGPREGFPFQVDPKQSLWNYHRVAQSDVDEPVVIVEGFKALMWVRMAGVTNVVALCGAGYSARQLELLGRLRPPFMVFLDNDAAGRSTTARFVPELRKRVSGVAMITYPREVAQPDDLTLREVRKILKVTDGKERGPSRDDGDQTGSVLKADRARSP